MSNRCDFLLRPIEENDPNTLLIMLEENYMTVNQRFPSNMSNSHFFLKKAPCLIDAAAFFASKDVFKSLINEHANVDTRRNIADYSLLHYACAGGDEEIVDYVLSRNVYYPDAIIPALLFGHTNLAEKIFLLEKSRNQSKDDEQILYDMVKPPLSPLASAIKSRNIETVAFVLSISDSEIPRIRCSLKTPLHIAVKYDSPEILILLLGKQADMVNLQDGKNNTPLMKAIKSTVVGNPQSQCARILLDQSLGTNIQYIDNMKRNIIHYIVLRNDFDMLNIILTQYDYNYIINQVDSAGFTPFHLAVKQNNLAMVEALCNFDGINIWIRENFSRNPIHTICISDWSNGLNFLLSEFPQLTSIHLSDADDSMLTPFLWAAIYGSINVLKVILSYSLEGKLNLLPCIIQKSWLTGWNAAHWAAHEGHAEFLELFIQAIQNTDNSLFGSTTIPTIDTVAGIPCESPLLIAVKEDKEQCVAVLLKYGACPLIGDKLKSPLNVARVYTIKKMIEDAIDKLKYIL